MVDGARWRLLTSEHGSGWTNGDFQWRWGRKGNEACGKRGWAWVQGPRAVNVENGCDVLPWTAKPSVAVAKEACWKGFAWGHSVCVLLVWKGVLCRWRVESSRLFEWGYIRKRGSPAGRSGRRGQAITQKCPDWARYTRMIMERQNRHLYSCMLMVWQK